MFLERPHTKPAYFYHFIPPFLVLGSLCFGVAGTTQRFENNEKFRTSMLLYEVFLLVFFVSEYFLRIWSCEHVKLYRGFKGKIRFVTSLYMSIDAFVITSTAITSCIEVRAGLTLLQVARFFQIFRLLRIDRRRGDLITMAKVVRIHGKELITCYFIGSIILYCGAYLVYMSERFSFDEGRHFNETSINDMTDSLYWAVITVTSVGYGDYSPNTWGGKIVTCAFAIVGTAFFALPAGIIGSGFALQISKRKKQKQLRKLRNPAACLIQRFWRLYAIGHDGREASVATTSYLLSKMHIQSNKRKSSILHDIEIEFFQYTTNSPNPAVRPTPIASSNDLHSETKTKNPIKSNLSTPATILKNNKKKDDDVDSGCCKSIAKTIHNIMKCKKDSSVREDTIKQQWQDKFNLRKLPAHYRVAILFLHRINLWIAMKNFKNLRNPFLNMEDMMEKNTRHHVEMITHFEDITEHFDNINKEFTALKTSNDELKRMVLNLTEALQGTKVEPSGSSST